MNVDEIKKKLSENYIIRRRKYQGDQIVTTGGYVAGEIGRREGEVVICYTPDNDSQRLVAMMDLRDFCKAKELPYSVSTMRQQRNFLSGGIEFRKGLLKRLDAQIKEELG